MSNITNRIVEDESLKKQQFIENLSSLNIRCMVLDDYLINPNEIVVFTNRKKQVLRAMHTNVIPQVVFDEGIKRCINIISYKELGIEQWERDLWKNGNRLSENVTMIDEEDSYAVFLYYAFTYVERKHWLYYNILYVLKQHMCCSCTEELQDWLALYMSQRKYCVKVRRIVELPQRLDVLLSLRQRCSMIAHQVWLKLIRKLTLMILREKGKLHKFRTRNKYLQYLQQTCVVGNAWEILNKRGSSGCTLIKSVNKEAIHFVKGNELPIYRGIKNEIYIQNILLHHSKDATWFLPMLDSDPSFHWIKYEYVTWKLLNEYIRNNRISESELDLLGEYLVNVLDNLHSLDIVHNDLRGENIMVRVSDNGTFDGFVLTDFGCSSHEGNKPWEQKTYWGKFFAKGACGSMRYNEVMIDDAASALLVYLSAGGNHEDRNARRIRERIGRIYFSINE